MKGGNTKMKLFSLECTKNKTWYKPMSDLWCHVNKIQSFFVVTKSFYLINKIKSYNNGPIWVVK